MNRRWLLGGAAVILILVAALAAMSLVWAPGAARSAALAKVQAAYPAASWHVTATQFYWRPGQVHDPQGQLVYSQEGGSLLAPTFVVYLDGQDSSRTYSANTLVHPITDKISSWSVASTPRR